MSVRAGTRGGDIVGYLEQEVLAFLTPVGIVETDAGLVAKPTEDEFNDVADMLTLAARGKYADLLLAAGLIHAAAPDVGIDALALVARRLDEKAGPWAWWAERFWKWAYSWKTEEEEYVPIGEKVRRSLGGRWN